MVHCLSPELSPKSVSFMVSRGAEIHARDTNGGTCLHWCLCRVCERWRMKLNKLNTRSFRDAVHYLIKSGVDMFAEDNDGVSVSSMAYQREPYDKDWCGLSGDIWDSILADLGYDVGEFRGKYGQPWKPTFHEGCHTIEDLEMLWQGKEHLCPYYEERFRVVDVNDSEDEDEWATTDTEEEEEETEDEGELDSAAADALAAGEMARRDCDNEETVVSGDGFKPYGTEVGSGGTEDESDDDGGCLLD
jgi:hypothetical protein